jgi:hypothetical protein
MTINQASLHDLCVRAATGDEDAQGEFHQHVPPLVELVVRRWLHQQHKRLAPGVGHEAAYASRRAGQITADVCARMIAESRARLRPAVQAGETLVIQRGGDTLHWTTSDAPAPCGP